MLRKKNRITKENDFDKFFGRNFKKIGGRNSSSSGFVVKAMKNELGEDRFGIIVSNKIEKRAVYRNKIKRRIREVLKKIKTEKRVRNINYDILIVVQKGVKEMNYEMIEKEVGRLVEKAVF